MNYWLVKSEPEKYSWDQLVADGVTQWDGVRNYAARNNLKAMELGDQVLFYHSREGLEIVGIAKVVKEHYPDPTAKEGDWVAVQIAPHRKLAKPVPLAQIKQDERLKDISLVRLGRLSVGAITPEEFKIITEE